MSLLLAIKAASKQNSVRNDLCHSLPHSRKWCNFVALNLIYPSIANLGKLEAPNFLWPTWPLLPGLSNVHVHRSFNVTIIIQSEGIALSCDDFDKEMRILFNEEIEKPSILMNKSLAEITCNINEEIHMKMGRVEQGLAIVSNFVSFLVLLLIVEAIWYWWCYIHKVIVSSLFTDNCQLIVRKEKKHRTRPIAISHLHALYKSPCRSVRPSFLP